MKASFIRVLYRPVLNKPVLVEGLPGFGGVGEEAARLLIDYAKAQLFAELYSPHFPDYTIVDRSGICNLPRYQFHWAKHDDVDLIILTGDTQPSPDDLPAHYEVCGLIVDFIREFDCRFIVSLGGMPSSTGKPAICVAATSPRLVKDVVEDGVAVYRNGMIAGATGLLLGLARIYGIHGICLLGAAEKPIGDREAGFRVFHLLTKLLKSDVIRNAIHQS